MTKKILLAEDDITMVSLLKTLLKMEGFQVIVLDADADVPAAVRREHPDIVLLDVHLSRQSGLEILATIREAEETKNVPVVMTSGADVKDVVSIGINHPQDLANVLSHLPEALLA